MRKIQGIKRLTTYLASVNHPLSEAEIQDLMLRKTLPHNMVMNNIIIFDLDHIDWWISQNRLKNNKRSSTFE